MFLKRLESKKDSDGNSVLHNSMIFFASGNSDGNRHTHTNVPVVLAGGGGGRLTPGRFVDYNDQPLSNLFVAMSHKMGLRDVEQFGDSTGMLKGI